MFGIMNGKMVVTNVRMSREDWLRTKAAAGEMGMSINEYINFIVDRYSTFKAIPSHRKSVATQYSSIWDLVKEATKIKRQPMGCSEEDHIIYGD